MFTLPLVLRGIREVVIERPELDARTTDTAFGLNLAIGVTVSAALFAATPLIAIAFHDERIVRLAHAGAMIPFLASIGVLQEALLEREFRHRRITTLYLVASLISLAAGVAVVLLGSPDLGAHQPIILELWSRCRCFIGPHDAVAAARRRVGRRGPHPTALRRADHTEQHHCDWQPADRRDAGGRPAQPRRRGLLSFPVAISPS